MSDRATVTPPSRRTEAWRAALSTTPHAMPGQALGVRAGDVVTFVAAHPDDETFAAGATLAQLALDGVAVHLITLTAGEAALDHLGRRPPGLAERRTAELANACQALGVATHTVVGLPDGGLARHEVAAEKAVALLLERTRPTHVLAVWWEDPHADHQVAGRVALRGAHHAGVQVSGFPIWAQHWSDPTPLIAKASSVITMTVSAAATRARAAATSCYLSQVEPLAGDLQPVLPADMLAWDLEIQVTP